MRAAAVFAVAGLLAAGCGGDDASDDAVTDTPGAAENDGDTGVELTMWTRSATQEQSQQLVDAYNESHENRVELTVTANDDYNQQVASAAGAGELPDIFAADVVFVPNFVQQGLYLDIMDRIDGLDYTDSLAPSHIDAGTQDDVKYVVPHTLDLSVLFYNKGPLRAGRPGSGAAADHARRVRRARPGHP
jgi:multiple sugar transport system substrate-binding protein